MDRTIIKPEEPALAGTYRVPTTIYNRGLNSAPCMEEENARLDLAIALRATQLAAGEETFVIRSNSSIFPRLRTVSLSSPLEFEEVESDRENRSPIRKG
jgi:hypothetical protein